jgi:hypothetical protein
MFSRGLSLVFVLGLASSSFAQGFSRGWVDVDLGFATTGDTLDVSAVRTIAQEPATFGVKYNAKRGALVDFGGGVMISPSIGFGVMVTGTAHKGSADLSANIPHPLRFNAYGSDTSFTENELERTEGTIHLQAVYQLPGSDRMRIRVFGGPSYFRLNMDAVTLIRYEQQFQVFGAGNTIDITNYDSEKVEHTGWGFHAGADMSTFFSRVVGVGVVGRYSRGTVTIDDLSVLADDDIDVRTGGFQLSGGLRLRF